MLLHLSAAVGISRGSTSSRSGGASTSRAHRHRSGRGAQDRAPAARSCSAVLLVSIITNMFGFSYAVLVTPDRDRALRRVGPRWWACWAAAEPLGGRVSAASRCRPAGYRRTIRASSSAGAIVFSDRGDRDGADAVVRGRLRRVGGRWGSAPRATAIMQTSLVLQGRADGAAFAGDGAGHGVHRHRSAGACSWSARLSEAAGPTAALITMSGIGLALLALVRWADPRAARLGRRAPADRARRTAVGLGEHGVEAAQGWRSWRAGAILGHRQAGRIEQALGALQPARRLWRPAPGWRRGGAGNRRVRWRAPTPTRAARASTEASSPSSARPSRTIRRAARVDDRATYPRQAGEKRRGSRAGNASRVGSPRLRPARGTREKGARWRRAPGRTGHTGRQYTLVVRMPVKKRPS